jgi:cation transport regulator ChaC
MTEGVVYYIPDDQAQDCLAELDFREKGVSSNYCFSLLQRTRILTLGETPGICPRRRGGGRI